MEKLFVYGTLIDPEIQASIIGRVVVGMADVLHDYQKGQASFGPLSYPMIHPQAGAQVQGHVLEVTLAELDRIDHYETTAYSRVQVTLQSGQQAWVYTRNPEPPR